MNGPTAVGLFSVASNSIPSLSHATSGVSESGSLAIYARGTERAQAHESEIYYDAISVWRCQNRFS